jgi:hypothetical protein
VIKGVLNPDECKKARSLFWDWLEEIERSDHGQKKFVKGDCSTLVNKNAPFSPAGLTQKFHGSHS